MSIYDDDDGNDDDDDDHDNHYHINAGTIMLFMFVDQGTYHNSYLNMKITMKRMMFDDCGDYDDHEDENDVHDYNDNDNYVNTVTIIIMI